MRKIDFKKLWDITKRIFLDEFQYQMKKNVTDFSFNDTFIGDFFSYLIVEKIEWWDPIFYSTWWPFDIFSKKEAYSAQIYQSGKIIYNEDFKESTGIRTGLIAPMVADMIHFKCSDKKVLIVWSGRLARNGILSLLDYYPNIKTIYYTNSSERNRDFEDVFKDYNFSLLYIKDVNYADYDYISFYTNASESLLKEVVEVKPGAFIASHISSTNYWEIADEIYKNGNVIVDWENNKWAMKDLLRAIDSWFLKKENILTMKDVLEWKDFMQKKSYTILRSTWTPMQNVAILKYIMESAEIST